MSMENILNNIELIKLKKHLNEQYDDDTYFNFAITDVKFNANERIPKLYIKLNYYNDMERSIVFTFNKFLSYTPIGESYLFDSKENLFEGFSIISISKKSLIKDFMFENYQFGFILSLTQEEIDQYFIYRIMGQNFFIDILTNQLPEIIF